MATKRTLYQVLQVAHNASPEIVTSAYEARLRQLEGSHAPEVNVERTVLRDAFAILSDPVRRKLYDDKLREESMRALSSGGEVQARPRSASVRLAEDATEATSSPLGWMVGIAALAAVAIGGGWIYLDHKRQLEAQHIEKARLAEEARRKDEAAQRQSEVLDWAKQNFEKQREMTEQRRQETQRQYERARWQSEQDRVVREQRYFEQRKAAEARRAEYEQRREEQESLRRQQQQLERERRLLQEYERTRGMKF